MNKYDVIIIGSGITGMTSAIYLKRANKKVLVLESSIPGGQLSKISTIENYPGYLKIEGPELAMKVYEQMNSLNIDLKMEEVTEIINEENIKKVITKKGEYLTDNIIIATGRVPKKLGLEKEESLIGRGISFCSICDGPLYKDKTVMVVGGGNSALEQTLYLSKICKEVILVHRRKEFRGEAIRVERMMKQTNVKIMYDTEVRELIEDDSVLASVILNNGEQVKIDGLFIAIGYQPNFDLKTNFTLDKEFNYLKVDENKETNIKGIYAAGDIIFKTTYQLTTAVSDATEAALSIIEKK